MKQPFEINFKILFIVLLLFPFICNAQKKAVTESGDEVILYANGTWSYTKEFNQDDSNFIKTNPLAFNKSKNATFLLKAKNGNIGFWLDPQKWTFEKGKTNPNADFELNYKGASLMGVIMSESAEIPLESYVQIALINGRQSAPDLKITDKEYRIVNGLKILHLQMEGTQVGVKFIYSGYYFSDSNSTVQFLVVSYSNEMKKHEKEAEELLNGIVEFKPDSNIDLEKKGLNPQKNSDTISQGSISPYNNCKQFFEGKWKYKVNGQSIDVERTMQKTIEYSENRKYKFEYTNIWIDSCTYELVLIKTNKPNYKLEKIGETMNVEILEIDKKEMKYSVTFRGSAVIAEMSKVN